MASHLDLQLTGWVALSKSPPLSLFLFLERGLEKREGCLPRLP